MVSYKFHLKRKSLVALVCCVANSYGQMSYESELLNRQSNANSAYELLKSGDEAYGNADYTKAVDDFAQALDKLPTGTRTQTLRTELGDRYATAASQQAKSLVSKGDLKGAKELLNEALIYSPNNSYAKNQLEKLNDPIATNPALTPDHVSHVDQVRRLLYEAEGAYNLGKFDEANTKYNDVLKIDKYNKAARRGMERVEARKTDYYRSAYDQTRSKMLEEVEAAWETPTNQSTASGAEAEFLTSLNQENELSNANVLQKLDAIILPRVDFTDMDLFEALDNLRALSKQYDNTTVDPDAKGLQFLAKFSGEAPELSRRFNLNLSNIPIGKVVNSIADLLGVQYAVDGAVVSFSSGNGSGGALLVKTYAVSPDFLTLQSGGGGAEADPFANVGANQGALAGKKVTARELLESYGIDFPDGATASYLPATSTLIVKNTENQHQVISRILNELSQDKPLMVQIEVKLINITQDNAKDLGSDVSIEGTIVESITNGLIAGGSIGNAAELNDILGRPLTAGNRTGDNASPVDSINSALTRSMGRIATFVDVQDPVDIAAGGSGLISSTTIDAGESASGVPTNSAPGIFSVSGSLSSSFLTAMIRGLDQKKGTDFFQKPSFITQSGQQAKVTVGREFIYPTEYEPPEISEGSEIGGADGDGDDDDLEIPADYTWYVEWDLGLNLRYVEILGNAWSDQTSAVTPSHPTSFDTKILGTEIDILPTVSSDGQTVDIGVKATHRELEGFINYGSPIPGVSIDVAFENPWHEFETPAEANGDNSDFDYWYAWGTNPIPPGPNTSIYGDVLLQTRLFQASENKILMPVFRTLNTETSVTVYDGASLILGGLIESTPLKVEDKTPILGSIPGVGRLFRSESNTSIRKNIIVAVTAKVVDPTGRPIKGSL